MKLLILNYEFPPLGGGGGSFSRDLAFELAKDNEVDVLTTHFKGLMREEKLGGVNVYRVPVVGRSSLYYATLPSLFSFPPPAIMKGLELNKKKNYDIINTHFAVPTGPAGSIISRLSDRPNILSIHGSDIYNPIRKDSPHKNFFYSQGVKYSFNNSERIIANSNYIKEMSLKYYSPKKNIDVIPLGMKKVEFPPAGRKDLGLDENKTYIVSMGRFNRIKGCEYLLRALKDVEDAHLLLIGDGEEKENLKNLASELGITNRVEFLGWVTGEKKYQYLALGDLYVVSSIHEGFGMTILEAMGSGTPIVSTNVGGQKDIIRTEENGILVPPCDFRALAKAIKELLQNKEKRERMISFNREYVKSFYISETAKKYLEIFNDEKK